MLLRDFMGFKLIRTMVLVLMVAGLGLLPLPRAWADPSSGTIYDADDGDESLALDATRSRLYLGSNGTRMPWRFIPWMLRET